MSIYCYKSQPLIRRRRACVLVLKKEMQRRQGKLTRTERTSQIAFLFVISFNRLSSSGLDGAAV